MFNRERGDLGGQAARHDVDEGQSNPRFTNIAELFGPVAKPPPPESSSPEDPPPPRVPNRGIALLLSLFGPWGTGHYYLGQTQRAFFWLIFPTSFLVAAGLMIRWLEPILPALMLAAGIWILLMWGWSIVDLFVIPKTRLRRAGRLAVAGFWLVGVIVTVALRFYARTCVIEAYKVPSESMVPTVLSGDHIFVDKFSLRSKTVGRGAPIVFPSPEHPEQDFIKRVIAKGGDTVELKAGRPWINGWEVPHCPVGKATNARMKDGRRSGDVEVEFLDGEAYLTFYDDTIVPPARQGPYHVPKGELWVLGDNRNNSLDSASWFNGRGGGIAAASIHGRALFRWLSFGYDGGVLLSRVGTQFRDPLLPPSMNSLQAGLERCLAARPSREQATPSNPRQKE